MKLYLHAQKEKDYETQWELYTKEENYVLWDKKEHMETLASYKDKDFNEFKNPINIRIYSDEKMALISWEDKFLEEYDGNGYPFRFSFNLVKSKDGVWKVAFMPMQ